MWLPLLLLWQGAAYITFMGWPTTPPFTSSGQLPLNCLAPPISFPAGLYFRQSCVANQCINSVRFTMTPDLRGYGVTFDAAGNMVFDMTPLGWNQLVVSTQIWATDQELPDGYGNLTLSITCELGFPSSYGEIQNQVVYEGQRFWYNISNHYINKVGSSTFWITPMQGLPQGSQIMLVNGIMSGVVTAAEALVNGRDRTTPISVYAESKRVGGNNFVKSNTFTLTVIPLEGLKFAQTVSALNVNELVDFTYNISAHFSNPNGFGVTWASSSPLVRVNSQGILQVSAVDSRSLLSQPTSIVITGTDSRFHVATSNAFSISVIPSPPVANVPNSMPDGMCGVACCSWNPADYVSNPSGNPMTFRIRSGLHFGTALKMAPNGTIYGTPTMVDVRSSPITLLVEVNNGVSIQVPFTFRVLPLAPPTLIANIPDRVIKIDQNFSFNVLSSFSVSSQVNTFTVNSTNPAVQIDSTGNIFGILSMNDYTQRSIVQGTVTVSNVNLCGGGSASSNFLIRLDPDIKAPVINSTTLPMSITGCQGDTIRIDFSQYFWETRGLQLNYSVTGLLNGTGLRFDNALGILSGKTNSFDVDSVAAVLIVCATNLAQKVACLPRVSISFYRGMLPPVADPPIPSPVTALQGDRFIGYFNFHFYDPNNQPLIYSVAGLPPGSGMGIGPITGIFSGSPNQADYRASPLTLSVFATNEHNSLPTTGPCKGSSGRARADFILVVQAPPQPPLCQPIPPSVAQLGQYFTLDVSPSFNPGKGGHAIEFALRGLPRGSSLAIDSRSGVVSGFVNQVDLVNPPLVLVVAVTNGYGECQSTLSINGPPPAPPQPCPVTPRSIVTQNVQSGNFFSLDLSNYFVPFQRIPITYGLAGLPQGSGLSFETQKGILSGTPSPADISQASIQLTLEARCGSQWQTVSTQFTLVVTGQCSACQNNNGGCQQMCFIQNPKICQATCGCHQGMILAPDKRTCQPGNLCENNNGGCDKICTVINNQPVCSCPSNWILASNGRSCNYDPCGFNNGNCEQLCISSGQQARCDCSKGALNSDGKTCSSDLIAVGTIPPALIVGCQMFVFDFSTAFQSKKALSFVVTGLPPSTGFAMTKQGLLSGTPSAADCAAAQPMTLSVQARAGSSTAHAVMFVSAFCDGDLSACKGKAASVSTVVSKTAATSSVAIVPIPTAWAAVCVDFSLDLGPYFKQISEKPRFGIIGLPSGTGLTMAPNGRLWGKPTSADCAAAPLALTITCSDPQHRQFKGILNFKFRSCECQLPTATVIRVPIPVKIPLPVEVDRPVKVPVPIRVPKTVEVRVPRNIEIPVPGAPVPVPVPVPIAVKVPVPGLPIAVPGPAVRVPVQVPVTVPGPAVRIPVPVPVTVPGFSVRVPVPGATVRVPVPGATVRIPVPGTTVRVPVPGTTVRIPIPGATVRVPIPGATVRVPVPVQVPVQVPGPSVRVPVPVPMPGPAIPVPIQVPVTVPGPAVRIPVQVPVTVPGPSVRVPVSVQVPVPVPIQVPVTVPGPSVRVPVPVQVPVNVPGPSVRIPVPVQVPVQVPITVPGPSVRVPVPVQVPVPVPGPSVPVPVQIPVTVPGPAVRIPVPVKVPGPAVRIPVPGASIPVPVPVPVPVPLPGPAVRVPVPGKNVRINVTVNVRVPVPVPVTVRVPVPKRVPAESRVVNVTVPGPTVRVPVPVPVKVPGPSRIINVTVPGPSRVVNVTVRVPVPVTVPGQSVRVPVMVPINVPGPAVRIPVPVQTPYSLPTPLPQPLSVPYGQPLPVPYGKPIGQPVPVPYGQPVPVPYGQPVPVPYGQPVPVPYGQPVPVPYGQPVPVPYGQPVPVPYGQPIGQPLSVPYGQPVGQPLSVPYGQSIGRPLSVPYAQPQPVPLGQSLSVPYVPSLPTITTASLVSAPVLSAVSSASVVSSSTTTTIRTDSQTSTTTMQTVPMVAVPMAVSMSVPMAPLTDTDLHVCTQAQCGQPFFYNAADLFRVNGLKCTVSGLPPGTGIKFSENGVFSGAPNSIDAGTVNPLRAEVTGVDRYGASACVIVFIDVSGTCFNLAPLPPAPGLFTFSRAMSARPPVDANAGLLPVQLVASNQTFSLNVSRISFCSACTPGVPMQYQVLGLPAGSGLQLVSGALVGSPSNSDCAALPRPLPITVWVSQNNLSKANATVHLFMCNQTSRGSPILNGALMQASGSVGSLFYYNTAPRMSAVGNVISFSVVGLSPGSKLRMSQDGVLSGVLSEADMNAPPVLITAGDDSGNTVQATLTITVHETKDSDAPVFLPPKTLDLTVGNYFSLKVASRFFNDAGGNMTFEANGLVNGSGLKFDAAIGLLSGIPNQLDARQYQPLRVVVRARRNSSSTEGNFYLYVHARGANITASPDYPDTNHAPISTSVLRQVATEGMPFLMGVSSSFSDPDGDLLQYRLDGLPPGSGLQIDPVNGVISGTPRAADSEALQPLLLTVSASDSEDEVSEMFLLTVFRSDKPVNHAPVASLISDAASKVGQPLLLRLSFSFADPDSDILSYTVMGLPNGTGLSMDPSAGILKGIPSNADLLASPIFLRVNASDSQLSAQSVFTLTVTPMSQVNSPPISTPMPPITVSADGKLNYNVIKYFSDPDSDPLTFQVYGLPAATGFKFVDGILTGVPALADLNAKQPIRVGFLAFDGRGGKIGSILQMTVVLASEYRSYGVKLEQDSVNVTMSKSGVPQLSFTVGKWGSFQLVRYFPAFSSRALDDVKAAFDVVGLPNGTGLSINEDTGVLSGVPTGADAAAADSFSHDGKLLAVVIRGVFNTSVRNDTVSETVLLGFASGANRAPFARSVQPVTVKQGETLRVTLSSSFSDPDGDSLTYSITGLPAGSGFSIVPVSGVLFGIASGADSAADQPMLLTVIADDGQGGKAQETLFLTVLPDSSNSNPLRPGMKSCQELGWPVQNFTVCAQSPRNYGRCLQTSTFQEAKSMCDSLGARLCTVQELTDGSVFDNGDCNIASDRFWSSSECGFTSAQAVLTTGGPHSFNVTRNCSLVSLRAAKMKCCANSAALVVSTQKTCDQLPNFRAASDDTLRSICTMVGACTPNSTLSQARGFCQNLGTRLCTSEELSRDVARGSSCGLDRARVWTTTACAAGRAISQGTISSTLPDVPAQCTPDTEMLPFHCCADLIHGTDFQNFKAAQDKGNLRLSWLWPAYPLAKLSLQKQPETPSKASAPQAWLTPLGGEQVDLDGNVSFLLGQLQPKAKYVLRITPMKRTPTGTQPVDGQTIQVKINAPVAS